jgi:hypothetical protein
MFLRSSSLSMFLLCGELNLRIDFPHRICSLAQFTVYISFIFQNALSLSLSLLISACPISFTSQIMSVSSSKSLFLSTNRTQCCASARWIEEFGGFELFCVLQQTVAATVCHTFSDVVRMSISRWMVDWCAKCVLGGTTRIQLISRRFLLWE